MADTTKIEWTDATWNPITGCTVKSDGCKNCYAMTLAGTRLKNHWSRQGLTRQNADGKHVWTGEVRFNEQWLEQPLHWKKPRMIFVCAHGDLFHEDVPDEWIDLIFAAMALCPQHIFQVLTKRPDRMREYLTSADLDDLDKRYFAAVRHFYPKYGGAFKMAEIVDRLKSPKPLPNVWLGTSVEDQKRADERIDQLINTPAAVRWLSMEPLLGDVNLLKAALDWDFYIDWVVLGGESGKAARPMHPDWARSVRDQCADSNVPFFFKQWGEWEPLGWEHFDSKLLIKIDGSVVQKVDANENRDVPGQGLIEIAKVGKKSAGRKLDGRTHNAMPRGIANA